MPSPVTSIVFTDDTGAATLTNSKPFPANRFDDWTPIPVVNGALVHRQSDMTPTRFKTSVVRGVSFSLSKIPQRTSSAVRLVGIAERLMEHLQNGGSVTVNTGDTSTSSYSGLYLAPGTVPSLVLSDSNQLEYTLTLALFSPAGTRLTCYYDA